MYPGEPGYRGSYSTFPSTDLPSPDSGIGEQVYSLVQGAVAGPNIVLLPPG